jgi:PASTA domain
MPNVVGQNTGDVEAQLKGVGFWDVSLEWANPSYHSVWVASNWTVVSADPGPGCTASSGSTATVYLTK